MLEPGYIIFLEVLLKDQNLNYLQTVVLLPGVEILEERMAGRQEERKMEARIHESWRMFNNWKTDIKNSDY